MISKKTLLNLSLLTLFGFSFIGILINYFAWGKQPHVLFISNYPFWYELGIGLAYGSLTGGGALLAIKLGIAKQLGNQVLEIFANVSIGIKEILFFSFCAGFGEEILFRAGIQPFLGIWVTAIIFVAIHGYLNIRSLNVFLYGVIMVFMSAGLGYLYQDIGLWSAIWGHFMFDVVMFCYLIYFAKPT